jgi:hypothetical protein
VIADQRMRGSEIGISSGRYAQVWTFSEGQVIRWKVYRHHEAALKAAGMRE